MRNDPVQRLARGVPMLIFVGCIGACSTIPVHFYTLSSGDAATPSAISTFAIDVLPVAIPAQVSVPQFVVRNSAQSVAVLEHERWSAPLQDEIRVAVSQQLASALGAIDASRLSNADLPTYRVRIDIQRFDAWLDQTVKVDAVWSMTAPGKSEVALICPVQLAQNAAPGYSALVQAYQQSLTKLGDEIAIAVRATEAKQKPVCLSGMPSR